MKILSIGNSFSDDAQRYLYDLLANVGHKDIVVSNLFIGGCSLETHSINIFNDLKCYSYKKYALDGYTEEENYSIKMALLADDWDYISLQQVSWASGLEATFRVNKAILPIEYDAYIDYIVDYVKSTKSGHYKFLWQITWAYSSLCDLEAFSSYNFSQEYMDKGILEIVKKEVVPKGYFSFINSNKAIREGRLYFGDNLLYRDGFHLSLGLGRFMASMAFLEAIDAKSIDKVRYKIEEISEKELERIKEISKSLSYNRLL